MDAPTIGSLIDVIRQPAEQPVDIPVRAWNDTGGLLPCFLPGQYFSSSVEQIADIPVPHHGIYRGFQGFHPGQSTAASSEQIVDIPVPHGGRHLQDPGLASLPQEVPGEAFQGVFSTFPRRKKVRRFVRTWGRNSSRVEPIHAVGSAGGFLHGRSWCVDAVSRRLVETSGLRSRSLAAWVKAGPSSCVSLRLLLEEFLRAFLSFVLAQFALGIWYFISFVFASGSHCSGCLGVAMCTKVGFLDDFSSWEQCLVLQWIHVLLQYSGGFGRMYTFSTWW